MTVLSPMKAAFEGFRVVRREPAAVIVWMLLWLGALSLAAWSVAAGHRVVVSATPTYRSISDIAGRLGTFAAGFMALFLLVWATTTVATFRAVLRPHERRWFFLRLGADEFRVAVMTVAAFVLVLVFGGVPAYLLYILVNPIMRAVPRFTRDIEQVGAFATVCLDIWLGVRLSLLAVETFAERRFHLTAYWPVTQGRFWYLFLCYVICFVLFFLLSFIVFVLGEVVFQIAGAGVGPGDLVRRTSVLGLAGLLAVLTASFFTASSTLFCACQAHAFRAIVGSGKAGVAPA